MQSDPKYERVGNSQEKEEDYEIRARQSYQWQASIAERDTSASKYHDIHAFNRKRTLANQFFNEKQITKKNNKQFASGLRGGSKLKKAGGQHSKSPDGGRIMDKKSNSPVRKHPKDQTGEFANIMGSTQLTASTQPYVEHVINQNQGRWANIDQASVQARISVETSQGSQSNNPIHRVPNARPKLTMIEHDQQNQDQQMYLNPNASMSVMSLKAPGVDITKKGSSINRGYHQSQQPFPSQAAKNNIQNVTITQKMHGGALNPNQFGQRQRSNNNLHSPNKKRDLSLKNATVEQRLEHFAKLSQGDYHDDASRFVNFQGGQIGAGNLKMSFLGDDTSSKNVTFYGGVNNSAGQNSNNIGQGSSKGNQQFKSGAVNLKRPNGNDGLAGSTSRGDFPATNDFDELNKLIDGDVTQAKFDIIFGSSKGPNATAQSPSTTKKNFQIFPKDPAFDNNFGRRGTQKLEEESIQGLRVGSRILTDAVQGARGDKSSANDGLTPIRADHISPQPFAKQKQQISIPVIDKPVSSKYDAKKSNLESQEFKFNKKTNNPQVNIGNVFASQSTERTKTAGRPEEAGKNGFPTPMLTSTQKYDQLQEMVKNSTMSALPKDQDSAVDNKSPGKDPNKTSKINLIADEGDTDTAGQPKQTLFELNQVSNKKGPAPMPGRMHQLSSEYTRQINTGAVNSEMNAVQTVSPHLSDGGQNMKLDQILKQQTSASPMNDSFHNEKKESTADQGVSPIGLSHFNSPNDPRMPYPGGGSEPHLGLGNSNDISHVGVSPDIPFRQDDQQFSEIINIKNPPNSNKNQYQHTEGTMINSPMSGKPIRLKNANTRLAVSIGHPGVQVSYVDRSRQDTLQQQTSKHDISKQDDQLPIDVSGPTSINEAQSYEDGEQAILVKILEKMLKKHNVTKDQHKVVYQSKRVKPNIEDKLRSLDIMAEIRDQDLPNQTHRKDFCKQISAQIQELIRTKRESKVGTLTAYLERKLITDGKEANLLIKLQQLKTAQSQLSMIDSSSLQLSPLPKITGAEYALHNLNTSNQQNLNKKIDFNDLKSLSNYNLQSNPALMKGNAKSPFNDYEVEPIQEKALNAHPRHSQSVAQSHMLTASNISGNNHSPETQKAELQGVSSQYNINSQNMMFQSNQMIETLKNPHAKGSTQRVGGQTFVSQMGSSVDSLQGNAVPRNSQDKLNEWTESKTKDLTVVSESQQQDDQIVNNQENQQESSILSQNDYNLQQQALSSTGEYHSQYNRLESIVKFNLPVVTRKHLLQGPHDTSNTRLNEIHAKLRDPQGHFQLMERNAIVRNKYKSSFTSRNKNQSFSTISVTGAPSHVELINSIQNLPFDAKLSKNMLPKSISNQYQLSPPRFSGSQLQLASKPSVFSQMVSPSFMKTGGFGLEDHPIAEKVNQYKDLHQKEFRTDPETAIYKRQLQIRQQTLEHSTTNKRPKISEWIKKDVMLPIIGKNKTALFHSIDQLEVENISHQREIENKQIRNKLQSYRQPANNSRKQSQFGFRRNNNEHLETDCSHAPKNLKQMLKQQEKEASDLANQQEKHLMKQLSKIAEQMAGPETLPQIQVEKFDNNNISIKLEGDKPQNAN